MYFVRNMRFCANRHEDRCDGLLRYVRGRTVSCDRVVQNAQSSPSFLVIPFRTSDRLCRLCLTNGVGSTHDSWRAEGVSPPSRGMPRIPLNLTRLGGLKPSARKRSEDQCTLCCCACGGLSLAGAAL